MVLMEMNNLSQITRFTWHKIYGSKEHGDHINYVVCVICDLRPSMILDSVDPIVIYYSLNGTIECAGL